MHILIHTHITNTHITNKQRMIGCVGVCQLRGFGVKGTEYLLAMDVGGKNLQEWRQELTPHSLRMALKCLLSDLDSPETDRNRNQNLIEESVVGWPLEKVHVQGKSAEEISVGMVNSFFAALVLELHLGMCYLYLYL